MHLAFINICSRVINCLINFQKSLFPASYSFKHSQGSITRSTPIHAFFPLNIYTNLIEGFSEMKPTEIHHSDRELNSLSSSFMCLIRNKLPSLVRTKCYTWTQMSEYTCSHLEFSADLDLSKTYESTELFLEQKDSTWWIWFFFSPLPKMHI